MKINRLQLIAYGPFSGTTLDFSNHQVGFHLMYGPNEAGKSTALRALRNVLFGIPVRTPDSFHPTVLGPSGLRSNVHSTGAGAAGSRQTVPQRSRPRRFT